MGSTAGSRTNEEHGTRSPNYVCLVVLDCLPSFYPTHCSYMERINDLTPEVVAHRQRGTAEERTRPRPTKKQQNARNKASRTHAHLPLAHIIANANANAVPSSWQWDLLVTYY